jgi:hypothetical protein
MTFIVPHTATYYGLDVGTISDQIISVYSGQVIVVMNDNDQGIVQQPGDKFRYTITSSMPVLTYVVNANEAKRAEFDSDVAPVFDSYLKKFDFANLDTIYTNKYRSPHQQFTVTIPEPGRYALVIDTRVAQALDGKQTPITSDSVDLTYVVEKISNGDPVKYMRNVVGTTDMYPIDENGHAVTSA